MSTTLDTRDAAAGMFRRCRKIVSWCARRGLNRRCPLGARTMRNAVAVTREGQRLDRTKAVLS